MFPSNNGAHGDEPVPVAVEVADAGDGLHDVDGEDAEEGKHYEDGAVVPIAVAVDLFAYQRTFSLELLSLLLLNLVVHLDLFLQLARLQPVYFFEEDVAEEVRHGDRSGPPHRCRPDDYPVSILAPIYRVYR